MHIVQINTISSRFSRNSEENSSYFLEVLRRYYIITGSITFITKTPFQKVNHFATGNMSVEDFDLLIKRAYIFFTFLQRFSSNSESPALELLIISESLTDY